MDRDYGVELDALKAQLSELERLVRQMGGTERKTAAEGGNEPLSTEAFLQDGNMEHGAIYFSGYYRSGQQTVRCGPQERKSDDLLGLDRGKAAKVISALGHKQRLDLLLEVWDEPRTGTELVERLNMGTTGQLYHHLKALSGADLLTQEERGGRYTIPAHRRFPILLLLSAVSDLIDTSDFIDMTEARNEAHAYLGAPTQSGYDIHHLLWPILDNSIDEHRAGYCSELGIYLHDDGSITVTDNGRGIPIRLLPQTGKPVVQTVLTEIEQINASKEGTSFFAPGAEKEIGMAFINALSRVLNVEIRREGGIYRQEYRHGIPQTGLMMVGETNETGTSITFKPERDLFASGFDKAVIEARVNELREDNPELRFSIQ
ncbi:ATP-binding protein [Paenibacillus sepulcri]|uniref:DNA topoisomerase (ATP-hydrolyzing) n=1 Tax=Paenibacillus sepulcri TaxID=359917 RepID=A0ABS7CCY8_9BACL|nr:helix-turn-helix domain-containing protein [Paenibacillus sepulcri]